MGTGERKAGTQPNQRDPGTPKGWTTSEQDQCRPPLPQGSGRAATLS